MEDPADYRWCGYAEAVAGLKVARNGLAVVIESVRGREVAPQRVVAEYRMQVFGRGRSTGVDEDGRPVRRGVSEERVREVLEKNGRLDGWESLRCRVRYLSDGVVLGSREFVDAYFHGNRERFGRRREDGARKLRYLTLPGLFSLRDLQKAPIG